MKNIIELVDEWKENITIEYASESKTWYAEIKNVQFDLVEFLCAPFNNTVIIFGEGKTPSAALRDLSIKIIGRTANLKHEKKIVVPKLNLISVYLF